MGSAAFCAAWWTAAALAGVEVEAGDPIVVAPGQVVAVPFQIRSDVPTQALEYLDLPERWDTYFAPGTLRLGGAGAISRVVGVVVPWDAPAGDFLVSYRLRDGQGEASAVRVLRVPAREALSVYEGVTPPELVVGATTVLSLDVVNEGNGPRELVFRVVDARGLRLLTANVHRVDLDAGQATRVEFPVRAPIVSDGKRLLASLGLRVETRDGVLLREVEWEFPVVARTDELLRQRQMELAAGAFVSQRGPLLASQIRLSGDVQAGAKDGLHVSGFLLSPPLGKGAFSGRQQYFDLRGNFGERWTAAAHDGFVPSGTELRAEARYGHEARSSFEAGRWTLDGGMAWGSVGDAWRQWNVRLNWAPTAAWRARLGWYWFRDANGDETPLLESAIRWAPSANHEWTVDVGANALHLDAPEAWSGAVSGRGRLARWTYEGRWSRVGDAIGGLLDDVQTIRARSAIDLGHQAAVVADYDLMQSNRNVSAGDAFAIDRERAFAGTRWYGAKSWSGEFGAIYGAFRQRAGSPGAATELGGRLRGAVGQTWRAESEWLVARIDDSEAAHPTLAAMTRTRLSGRFRWGGIGLSAAYGPPRASAVWFASGRLVSADVAWNPNPALAVQGSWAVGLDALQNAVVLNGVWTHESGVRLGLGGTLTARGKAISEAAQLSVHVPFRVPVGLDHRVGVVRGRVVDPFDGSDNPGVPGVVVCAGDVSAMTDLDGRFVLLDVPAGVAVLSIDPARSKVGGNLVGDPTRMVQVPGGKVSEVEIEWRRAGRVVGRIFTEDLKGPALEASGAVQARGFEDVLVELYWGVRKYAQRTDGTGAFAFENIPEGRYRVVIDGRPIPQFYSVGSTAREIALAAGETETVNFVARPVARNIELRKLEDLSVAASDTGRALADAALGGAAGLLLEPPGLVVGLGQKLPMNIWAVRTDGRRVDVSNAVGLVSSDVSIVETAGNSVVGKRLGNADVFAGVGSLKSAVRRVEVVEGGLEGLVADYESIQMPAGGAIPLEVGALLGTGDVRVVTDTVRWTSSDPSVARMDDGVLFARAEGTTTLVARWGQESTLPIVVDVGPAATGQVLAEGAFDGLLEMKVGETVAARAEFGGGDWTGIVHWRNEGTAIRVDMDGKITGVKPGFALVIAVAPDGALSPLAVRVR